MTRIGEEEEEWTIGPTVQLADTPSPQSATLGFQPIAIATTHFPSWVGG